LAKSAIGHRTGRDLRFHAAGALGEFFMARNSDRAVTGLREDRAVE